jgi:hypothetical protein
VIMLGLGLGGSNHLCSVTDQLIPAHPLINVPLFVGARGAELDRKPELMSTREHHFLGQPFI